MKGAAGTPRRAVMAAVITVHVSSNIADLENRGQDVIMRITGFPQSAEESKKHREAENPIDSSSLILMPAFVQMICREPPQPNPQ